VVAAVVVVVVDAVEGVVAAVVVVVVDAVEGVAGADAAAKNPRPRRISASPQHAADTGPPFFLGPVFLLPFFSRELTAAYTR
jgi:hypothetical protein